MPGPIVANPIPDWLKPENASVTDSALTKAMRMIGHLIGADNPTSQVLGLMMSDVPSSGEAGGLSKAVAGLKDRVIKAYHGSPHDFERFSLEKIGTGEGAQAYGHGLYFAENPEVAGEYKRQLSDFAVKVGDKTYSAQDTLTDPVARAARALAMNNGSADAAKRELWDASVSSYSKDRADFLHRALKEVDALIPKGVQKLEGRMYEVAIHADPEDFLDWDKPLSQQSEKVQAAVRKAAGSTPYEIVEAQTSTPQRPNFLIKVNGQVMGASNSREQAIRNAEEMVAQHSDPAEKGAAIYKQMSGFYAPGSPTAQLPMQAPAAERLKQAGIPGIKYLDQGSRAAGEGSRNYVVFDDRLIDILKKYGLLLPAAGAATQGQTLISPKGPQ